MKEVFAVTAAIMLLGLGISSQAAITIDAVTVGDPGNAADTTGYGSVSYTYNIGKYEVAAAQYCDFLNHKANVSDPYGLYNTRMWLDKHGCKIERSGSAGSYTYSVASDYANRPVNFVSFWDACRFANWLGNGQGNGDTETGAYTLNGYNGTDGRTIQRNANWTWAVTSEDEWYKAAYYKGGGTNAGYWLYPIQSDSIDTTMANYYWVVGHTTDVGSYPYASAYGTFDQGGNVYEWNEAVASGTYRGVRGGSFASYGDGSVQSLYGGYDPTSDYNDRGLGFRVSQVPEPSSIIALLGGLAGVIGLRRRKA